MNLETKKLVLFGAGKIGRSFIGQLFSRSGYEVVFVDINPSLIEALNKERSYKVFVRDTHPETIVVNNVRGVHGRDIEKVVAEIVSADILAVSVGKNGLRGIVPSLSLGLLEREKAYPGRMLDIILAENMRNAAQFLFEELKHALPDYYPLAQRVGLVETSIGKMVPLIHDQHDDDLLSVYAEAYNTLIVDKKGFKNPIPSVLGMEAKENMSAWVDRKLFIHNFGHAAVAYMGYAYQPTLSFLWEVLEDDNIRLVAREAMRQSAAALQREHPGVFSKEALQEHIDDLLRRFSNRSLGDTVFRVGCDLYRKLSSDDRVVVPLMSAYNNGLPYERILDVLALGLRFKAVDIDGTMFPGDVGFHEELNEHGPLHVFERVCGFTPEVARLFLNQINERTLLQ